MRRLSVPERPRWRELAADLGFHFHTISGEAYWDERACYQFTLRQIEDDLEDPTQELHQMCLDVVADAVTSERTLARLGIPDFFRDLVAESWRAGDAGLYGRMDLVYDGTGPAKLLEYNADTPTSLYESAFFQWVWLEQMIESGALPADTDQYNAIQDKLVEAFAREPKTDLLHFAAVSGSAEDRGTVQYLQDCAAQAGHVTRYLEVEQVGIDPNGRFTNLDDEVVYWLFKLYPWEWMWGDEFSVFLKGSGCRFVEPPWKAVLSNKGLLPLLWERFPGHPNLLPAYFEDDARISELNGSYAKKPLFSREGSNVSLFVDGAETEQVSGPYGGEGFVCQALCPLPVFDGNHMVIGSWVVGGEACGIGIREDATAVTKDTSRFLPHIITE